MSILLLLGIVAIIAVIVADLVVIRRDGLGSNPPSRSHPADSFDDPLGGHRLF